jgi:hypothetical protein
MRFWRLFGEDLMMIGNKAVERMVEKKRKSAEAW